MSIGDIEKLIKERLHYLYIFYMGYGAEIEDLILEHQKGCIRGCEKFQYLSVKIDKED